MTFVQNSHDLWFNQMGDGQRKGFKDWVAPDGCLCDCASPGSIIYKQGDGRIELHDWGMEFTAAGLVMQAELLLVGRDAEAIARYLPKLERVANFIESRRDPQNNLFLAGPAGNLLAPSYAGWKRPDGKYDKAYLAGLSITCIAGLDRLIELEKLAGNPDKVTLYTQRRELARKGLPLLMTDEGYFIKYLDPDGTRHGVFGGGKARLLRGRLQPRRNLFPRGRRCPGGEDLRQDRFHTRPAASRPDHHQLPVAGRHVYQAGRAL